MAVKDEETKYYDKKLTSIVEKNKNARSHAVSDLGGTDGEEAQ